MMGTNVIIDVWMQHPTMRFINQPMFDSLRRWTGGVEKMTEEIPVEFTIDAMDRGGVQKGLICAWWGPQGPLISNDEVAAIVRKHPDRFIGIVSENLYQPMEAVRELRKYVTDYRFRGLRIVQWLWDLPATDRR